MTEAERVEQIYHNSSPDMLTPEGWQFLIKMARIGASVMPRPTIIDILDERQRQVTNEGWTIEHDDKHRRGEMAYAAAWYALNAESHDYSDMVGIGNGSALDHAFEDEFSWCKWPWSSEWWKPKDRRRDLVRAAALLVAEIERLDRSQVKP